jgi:hypothetical protein
VNYGKFWYTMAAIGFVAGMLILVAFIDQSKEAAEAQAAEGGDSSGDEAGGEEEEAGEEDDEADGDQGDAKDQWDF